MNVRLNGEARQLRGLMILKKKLTGMSNEALAQEFGCSIQSIERGMALAMKSKLVADYEAELFKDLVPLAMTAVKLAIVQGDAKTAIEILKGAGVLKKQSEKPIGGSEVGDELEIYIRSKRIPDDKHAASHPPRLPQVSSVKSLPPGPADTSQSLLPFDGLDSLPRIAPPPHDSVVELEGQIVGEEE